MTAALKIINSSLFPQSDHTNWSPQGVSHSGAHPGHPESDLFTGGRVQERQPRAFFLYVTFYRRLPTSSPRHSRQRTIQRYTASPGNNCVFSQTARRQPTTIERKLVDRFPIGSRQQGGNQVRRRLRALLRQRFRTPHHQQQQDQ